MGLAREPFSFKIQIAQTIVFKFFIIESKKKMSLNSGLKIHLLTEF